ncbi:MAG: hypothetical protein U1E51_06815 [Candidatus Binatia bacterium]|nr:hypothetical protein [Candidatus Binatia bacterium]
MSTSLRSQLAEARDWLFPRKCLRKQRWLTEATALAVIRSRLVSDRDPPAELYHYQCKECGGWHITKMKQI